MSKIYVGSDLQLQGVVISEAFVKVGGLSTQFLKADGTVDLNLYPPLNLNNKIPEEYLPDSVLGQVEYKGTWNASTNLPNIGLATASKGHYYVVNTQGTFETIEFHVGDWIISNGTSWEKVDNSESVYDVFGRKGQIVAQEGDYATFYPKLSSTYNNPDWINSLSWSKITDTPNTLEGYGITNTQNIPYVVGTQTVTTASWTGVADTVETLYDGLSIRYWLPRTSSTNVTLNLTLKDGSTTGAIPCYYGGTTRLTTHYPAGSFVMLTYVLNQLINGVAYTGWWAKADYDSGTESYTVRWNSTHQVGAALYSYKIVMFGTDGKLYPLTLETGVGTTKTVSTVEFSLSSTILYYGTTTTIAINGTQSSNWYEGSTNSNLHYTANQATGFVAYAPLYLKGTITASGNFKLDNTTNTSWLTQTLPTSEDGFVYMLLGHMYNTTTAWRLTTSHPILEYKDGKIRLYVPSHTHHWSEIYDTPDLTNIENWNTAFSWGNFRDYGLGITTPQGVGIPGGNLNSITTPNGFYKITASTLNSPVGGEAGVVTIERSGTDNYITQKAQMVNVGDIVRSYIRHYKPASSAWTPWRRLWTTEDFTVTQVGQWNTAYSWGDHANKYINIGNETDPIFSASPAGGITEQNKTNWNTAFGWGNHANAGYLTSLPTHNHFPENDLRYVRKAGDTMTGNLIVQGGSDPEIRVKTLNANGRGRVTVENSAGGFMNIIATGPSYIVPNFAGFSARGLNMIFVTNEDISQGGSNHIVFSPGGYDNIGMVIKPNHYVGIGTGSLTPSEQLTVDDNVLANSFIKRGGLSTQFLKADGSVDTSPYITGITVSDDNANIRKHKIATVQGTSLYETLGEILEPELIGNILYIKFRDGDGVIQSQPVNLSSLVTTDTSISNATYNASTNRITITQNDGGDPFIIDLSEFSILTATDANGITTLKQEVDGQGDPILKLTVSKVGQTGQWADILGKPATYTPEAHTHSFTSLTSRPTTISGYGITDAMTTLHPANNITGPKIANWDTAYGWGNHASAGYLTSLPGHNHDTEYVNVTGDTMTGDLNINASLKINSAEVTTISIDSVVTTIPVVGNEAAFFDYLIKREDGIGLRSGTVMAVWNGTTTQFTDTSTKDLGGSTEGIELTVDILNGNVRLNAVVTSGSWKVKVGTRTL